MKYRRKGGRPRRRDSAEELRIRRELDERLTDLGNRDQVRTLRLAGERRAAVVTRCGRCGHQWPTSETPIVVGSACERCGSPIRSCRHCALFDPRERFECRADIPERIADKWAGNECIHFRPREVLDTTGRQLDSSRDARAAFQNLFGDS